MDEDAKKVKQYATELAKLAASDPDWTDEGEVLLGELWFLLDQTRLRAQRQALTSGKPVTVAAVIARALKVFREGTSTTQQQLAEDMQRLGFVTWKRITVAE